MKVARELLPHYEMCFKDKGVYIPTQLQLFIAAELSMSIDQDLNGHMMSHAAGQGKSRKFLLVMQILNKIDPNTYKKFMVIT